MDDLLAPTVTPPAGVAQTLAPPGLPFQGDRSLKRRRVQQILEARGAHTLVLTSFEALSWYFDGARVSIAAGGPPIIAVAVSAASETVFCFNNERERMLHEELPADLGTLVAVPWHRPLVPHDLAPGRPGVLQEAEVPAELRAARATLLPGELARYRTLAAEMAQVLTATLGELTAHTTEIEVARQLGTRITEVGGEPLVLLVAGEKRLGFRHPLPTAAPVGNRAMAVICARRHGMIVNLSRWVRFTEPSAAEQNLAGRIAEVEADAFAATVPGASVASILADIASSYGAHGFRADEWEHHHQGGPTGYVGRDPRATPTVPDLVAPGQVFTWNPTAPGTKIEDTVLLTPNGIEVLTVDQTWPTTEVRGLARPIELLL